MEKIRTISSTLDLLLQVKTSNAPDLYALSHCQSEYVTLRMEKAFAFCQFRLKRKAEVS